MLAVWKAWVRAQLTADSEALKTRCWRWFGFAMAAAIVGGSIGVMIAAQPPPGHGPYSGANVICYRGDTQLDAKPKGRVHCDCKLMCDENGNAREASDCQTYCGKEQCVCHSDETCPSEKERR
jgi:hypothetical protein